MLPDRCIRVTIRLQGKRVPFRRRFRPFPSPVTSAHPSPATFQDVFVAHHLRPSLSGNVSGRFRRPSPPPYLSGNVSGRYRRPSPPLGPLRQRFGAFPSPVTSAIPLQRRFRLFSLPITSAHPSPATFKAAIVARHLQLLSYHFPISLSSSRFH